MGLPSLEGFNLLRCGLVTENAQVAVQPLLELAIVFDGEADLHAASPKKSLAVTLPPVASAIRPMTFLSGIRSPERYLRTASPVTLIRAAN